MIVPVIASSGEKQVRTYAMLDDGSTKVVISERGEEVDEDMWWQEWQGR